MQFQLVLALIINIKQVGDLNLLFFTFQIRYYLYWRIWTWLCCSFCFFFTLEDMSTSHILSAVDPHANQSTNGTHSPQHLHSEHLNANAHGSMQQRSSPNALERNLHVSLDDRELWLRFQNLTNEMIVTKNGR